MNLNLPVLAVALLLLSQPALGQTTSLVDYRNEKCDGSLSDGNFTDRELADLRDRSRNPFYDDYVDVFKYLDSGDDGALMDAYLTEFVLVLILLIVIFISLIVFIFFCCMCKKSDGEEGAGKSCVTVGCILFWLIVVLFVVFFAFVIMAAQELGNSQCGIMDSSVMILYGSKNTEWEFYGVKNFSALLTAFKASQADFAAVQNNFTNIFLARLTDSTNAVAATLSSAVLAYRAATTTNGAGVKETPISAEQVTAAVSWQIQSSFVTCDLTAQKLSEAAVIGKNMGGNFGVYVAQINSFQPTLDSAIANIEADVNRVREVMEENEDYAAVAFWIMFVFSLVVIILAAIVLCLLCKMCSNNDCMNCIYCSKFILVVLAVLVLVFGVLVIILMVGSVGMSSVCEVVGQLVQRNETILNDINVDVSAELKTLVTECLGANATGDLKRWLGIQGNLRAGTAYDAQVTLWDGLTRYQNYLDAGADTTAYAVTDASFKKIKDGEVYDHPDIKTTLDELNDLISCDGKSAKLTTAACGTEADCIAVASGNYSAPSCSDDSAKASAHYNNLNAYIQEETIIIDDLLAAVARAKT